MTLTKGGPNDAEERFSKTTGQTDKTLARGNNRRTVIKKIAVGGTALAGCSILPDSWTAPIVEFGALPAHATTSDIEQELADAIDQLMGRGEDTSTAEEVDASDSQTPAEPDPAAQEEATQEVAEVAAEDDADWVTVHWGGNPNETSESRDRTWWTKIHGGDYPHWHRKFPLPRWVDDRPLRLEFVFSDGQEFVAPNSQEMAMNSSGPKYRPEEHGERDPRKQHPKIGAARGATPTWVKFRAL